ncbi:MAG: hypothetical protein GY816_23370 [Cytophagales bacterium]|nr:hypothetical protein [Cytophagales bacterium]
MKDLAYKNNHANSGLRTKSIGQHNRQRVLEYFEENPNSTVKEAVYALGLSRDTIRIHRKRDS